MGFVMLKLLNDAESMLGGMVTSLLALYVPSVCAGMFSFASIANVVDLQSGTFYPVVLLFSLLCGVFQLCCAMITWYIFRYVFAICLAIPARCWTYHCRYLFQCWTGNFESLHQYQKKSSADIFGTL